MTNLSVIDETNHFLVIWKDAGILSQKDSSAKPDVITLAKAYLKERYAKKGDAYCGLVQRLDCPVSGLMVLAKSSKGASRLSLSLREGSFEKTYLAFATGEITCAGRYQDRLEKINQKAVASASGKIASLSYIPLYTADIAGVHGTLLMVTLETGRYNQIRAQFALHGYVLYGDRKYGYSGPQADLALSCVHLSFPDPVTKERRSYDRMPHGGYWPYLIREGKE